MISRQAALEMFLSSHPNSFSRCGRLVQGVEEKQGEQKAVAVVLERDNKDETATRVE